MTACNSCGGRMVPDSTALVPVLVCEDCGRMIPLPERKVKRSTRRRRELAEARDQRRRDR